MTAVLVCPRCRRLTVYDPSCPEDTVEADTHLCMECIFDEEEGHIVRGEK